MAKTTKKPQTKDLNAKAARTKKTTPAKNTGASTKTATDRIQMLAKPKAGMGTRRPPNNSDVPSYTISYLNLTLTLNEIKGQLEEYAAHREL